MDSALPYVEAPPEPPSTTEHLLRVLTVLLSPQPLLAQLPSALCVLAHFQFLAQKIASECETALDLQRELMYVEEALSEEDILDLQRIKKRCSSLSERIMELSLSFRQYHIAIALSHVALPKVQQLMNTYFPPEDDLSGEDIKSHPQMFIRAMQAEDLDVYIEYREKVMKWYKAAQRDNTKPSIDSLDPDYKAGYDEELGHQAIKLCEKVIQYAQDLQSMFIDQSVPSLPQQTGQRSPVIVKRLADPGSSSPLRTGKKPRLSSPSGPDYTIPSPSMGSRVDRFSMKPFDNRDLIRAGQSRLRNPSSVHDRRR